MIRSAIILSTTLLIFTPAVISADVENNIKVYTNTGNGDGDANASVKVNNQFGQNGSTTIESKTNVDIQHSGDGNSRSEVTVNGQTYTLEGPGSIKIGDGEVEGANSEENKEPTPTKVKTENVLGDTAYIGNSEDESTNFADAVKVFFETLFSNFFGF